MLYDFMTSRVYVSQDDNGHIAEPIHILNLDGGKRYQYNNLGYKCIYTHIH